MNLRPSKAIASIVQQQIVSCGPETSLLAVSRLMRECRCSSVLISEEGQPLGIWTESDAMKLDFQNPAVVNSPIQRWMSAPVQTINASASLDEAAHHFKGSGIRHLLVTDDQGKQLGILSQSDIVRHQDAEYFVHMSEVQSILPNRAPLQISQSEQLATAVTTMRDHQSDCIVITEQQQPVGMLTERDLVRLIAEDKMGSALSDEISKPLICIPATMTLLAARSLMDRRNIRHLGVTDQSGNLIGLISFADILSNIEQAYANRLREALASRAADLARSKHDLNMAHALIDASMDGIMVTDEQGIIQSVNPAFTILTGYSENEALGQNASLISSGKQSPEFYREMWKQIHRTGSWQGEIWNRRKSGELFPEWLTITAIHDAQHNRTLYAGIFSDITERKKSEEIIENLAYYDPLTRLPNRQLLFDRVDVALATAKRDGNRLALICIDLDHFKRINDSLGHSAGDQVLSEVSKRLQGCIRAGDTISRVGGDELILLLTELDNDDAARRIAQSAIEALKQPVRVEGHELYISASMGCSIYPQDGRDRDTLLKNADIAMYRTKQAGRNGFQLYCADMNERSMRQLKLENRLRIALSEQAFTLHYQPKVDIGRGEMIGVEALLRWQDPELGSIPPDEFIPLAEELGLIGEIGAWVINQACRQCRRWLDQGNDELKISINVSPQQLLRRDLTEDISQALQQADIPARLLDLEITESCLIEDTDTVATTLHRLRDQGVSISMDDFGTGYSSLSLLKRIPLDNLKIDRSFVDGIGHDNNDGELVSTIILMAHNLGLKVIAEGVETPQQLDYLSSLNCDQVQGYYFSKPQPADQIPALQKRSHWP
ncbi:EAL domain-containing protein [Motiliproteus sp.]|uniref:EAL domain-containing protein n=1 Tax=Motiliproteus sp. TaxID=1898955 RepID=UPI003BA9E129